MILVYSNWSPHYVGKALSNRQNTACSRIGQACLWRMAKSCSYAGLATVVESDNATIGQWKLHLTLCLLTCNLASDRTIHLVGEPILARYGLKLQHVVKILVNLFNAVCSIFIVVLHRDIFHYGLWGMSEHLRHIKVEGLNTIALNKREMCVASGLANNIERCALALCNLADTLHMFILYEQAHALLTLVGYDFLSRQSLVANWQLCHVYLATTVFHKF